MNTKLSEIKTKYNEGHYQEALALIEKVEREGILHPEVLLWKGRCLQLLDEKSNYQLSDIEDAFMQALEIDDKFTPALMELAWFYLNVLDKPERAAKYFEAVVSSCRQVLTEATIGMMKCLGESDAKGAAQSYIENISHNCLNMAKISAVLEEIESSRE